MRSRRSCFCSGLPRRASLIAFSLRLRTSSVGNKLNADFITQVLPQRYTLLHFVSCWSNPTARTPICNIHRQLNTKDKMCMAGGPASSIVRQVRTINRRSKVSKKVLLWGATGQARMLRECLAYEGYEVTALIDGSPAVQSPFPSVPLYRGKEGFIQWLAETPDATQHSFIVAIGSDKGKDRIALHEYVESHGLKGISARHPTAYVAESAAFGAGAQILPRAIVCVDVVAGRGCIINTGASVDHECQLGDGVHLCPGVRLAGCVEIGAFATLYTGAIVIPRIKIGEGAVVGAGAVVIRDVPPYTVVVGNPARELKR